MLTAQRKAELWHWADAVSVGALFVVALVGLVGHYKLRRQYQEETMNRRVDEFLNRGR